MLLDSDDAVVSKRDAAAFFDQLRAPLDLARWFAQPPVRAGDLAAAAGCEVSALADFLPGDEPGGFSAADLLYPVHLVWPMGYAWSSAIAQSCSVRLLTNTGFPMEAILSVDHDLPKTWDEVALIATDDTILIHKSRDAAKSRLKKLDASFARSGVVRNAGKDVNLAKHTVALGCDLDLERGIVSPAADKLTKLFSGLVGLLRDPRASPRAFAALLGLLQWFFQLQRGCFSILADSYEFARREPQDLVQPLGLSVQEELEVSLCLLPLLPASLTRPYSTDLLATDASTDFGFGVCHRRISTDEAQQLGRLSTRRGEYVRLDDEGTVPNPKPRRGTPFYSSLKVRSFSTIICRRAAWKAHPGLLESHALVLALKWMTRSGARHSCRPVILIDAQAVIGAFTKGRSSARSLRRVLRSAAAIQLAADLLPRLLYIPTEWNPADRPSRGRHWRPGPASRSGKRDTTSSRFCRARFGTKTERRLAKREQSLEKLMSGPYGYIFEDDDSSGSDEFSWLLDFLG